MNCSHDLTIYLEEICDTLLFNKEMDKQVTTCKLFSWVVSASNSLSCAWDAKSSYLDVKGGNFAFCITFVSLQRIRSESDFV